MNIRRIKCTLLLVFAIYTISVYGDIIIVEYSPNKICVRIENLKDFPDIVIVGVSDCFSVFSKPKVEIIDSSSCLKVPKTCPFTFYAVKKDYLEKNGIENINWKKDKNVRQSSITVNSKKIRIDYPNVETLEITYIIAGFKNNSMVMDTKLQTYKFNDGKPDSVVYSPWFDDELSEKIQEMNKAYLKSRNLQNSF